MKKVLVLSALSASLLVSFPSFAVEADKPVIAVANVKPAKPVKPPSDMFEALAALGTELKAAIGSGKGNPIPYFDKLAAHQYSDATKQKVTKVFGNTEPFTIKRSAAEGGMLSYVLNAPAHNYLDSNATTIAWSELDLSVLLDKAGRNMSTKGNWGSFSIADKTFGMAITDITLEGKQRRNAQNLWIGKINGGIGKIAITPAGTAGGAIEGITFASSAVERGTAVDIGYESNIKAIKFADEQVEDIRFAMRMLNIDMRALEKMTDGLANAEKAGKTPEQKLALTMEQFKLLGKSVAKRGSALEIDEFSAAFHGHRAVIKGKVWLTPSTDAEMANMTKLVGKINARVNVRVPVALVNEVAKIVMAKQAAAKGEKPTPEATAQMAQSVTDVVVGKMLNGGYAKLEDGVLIALIEFKNSKLTFNGKEVALPKTPPKPAKPAEDAKDEASDD
ncbi:MAG: DUF945 family protein [Pseudomonadota bacterium]